MGDVFLRGKTLGTSPLAKGTMLLTVIMVKQLIIIIIIIIIDIIIVITVYQPELLVFDKAGGSFESCIKTFDTFIKNILIVGCH